MVLDGQIGPATLCVQDGKVVSISKEYKPERTSQAAEVSINDTSHRLQVLTEKR